MIGNSGITGTYRDLPFLDWRVTKKVGDTYVTGTTGAVGSDTLFTTTGTVAVVVFGICRVSVTEAVAGATIMVYTSGNAAIAITDAELIVADKLWQDSIPDINGSKLSSNPINTPFIMTANANITQTIGTQALSAGQIDYYCIWSPLEAGASVVAA